MMLFCWYIFKCLVEESRNLFLEACYRMYIRDSSR